MVTQRAWSSAAWLALSYAVLVLYASLFPFEDWRWPPGQDLRRLLVLPSSRFQENFDTWANLLGYLPLGCLLTVAARRSGWSTGAALALALPAGVILSYSCEVLQQFMPGRVPSLNDLQMNALGHAAGALIALALHALGAIDRWQRFRSRWFTGDAAVALVLLALWPVGLLFPSPVPLGLGQVLERLREALAAALAGVSWAEEAYALLSVPLPYPPPLSPMAQALIVALGLVAPCLVAYSVVAPGWRRLTMAAGALLLAAAGMTLSTWLNFGPQHALAWASPWTTLGLVVGAAGALLLMPLGRRLVAVLGLVCLTALVVGVSHAPANPYFAQSLQAWELGRFVRFHGLAQWVGWLWPYAAMLWLLARLAQNDASRR
jgi:VanZ family protein